ncbi:hypothetical protein BW731_02195 [Vagococcus martis]|uniref:YcxB-like protein domain-containing protein n=2 Tax=Vagococcus martis TaxID=1768210 RepID=A0A1V4DF28_9ENTE|nr:hypothetical protein BW731_02195 [Vagococcus martis]
MLMPIFFLGFILIYTYTYTSFPKSQIKKNLSLRTVYKGYSIFTNSGIMSEIATGSFDYYVWGDIGSIFETNDFYFLTVKKTNMFVIYKPNLTEQEIEHIRNVINDNSIIEMKTLDC